MITTVKEFKTRYFAKKYASNMVGYAIKIVKFERPWGVCYLIQCNQNRYLYEDGCVM